MGCKWLTDIFPAISGTARRFSSSDLKVLLEAGGPPVPMDMASVRTEQWGDGEPVIVVTLKNLSITLDTEGGDMIHYTPMRDNCTDSEGGR